ncbi:FAD/NAD(P)-binding oxidoreductase family protein [Zea mays]|uniref:FAD/NAD(P)-binding oxidoreductase family protein n=1 Tax=Zea mays TaxID=4577 RepID=A0A1D6K0Q2_MAIZE|nr:FAD/NAD(P)-binding oxidoreductase family protein [Zea mays]
MPPALLRRRLPPHLACSIPISPLPAHSRTPPTPFTRRRRRRRRRRPSSLSLPARGRRIRPGLLVSPAPLPPGSSAEAACSAAAALFLLYCLILDFASGFG